MKYIEYKEGTVYDPAHLRPFGLELAKQGHPVAKMNGNVSGLEVSHMFQNDSDSTGFNVIYWNTFWQLTYTPFKSLDKYLRLAPLAVKDGKPLHVGDVIEIFNFDVDKYVVKTIKSVAVWRRLRLDLTDDWRWPVEVKG